MFRKPLFSWSVAVIALALPAVAAYGQSQVPNLSGTWVLQSDKSDFGPMAAPSGRTDVIEHAEPRLTIKRTVVFQGTPTVSDLVYVVDGKPHKNTTAIGEMSSTLSWEGQTLVMVTILTTAAGQGTITDRFSLSADGKTMTVGRTLSSEGQDVPQRMVFAKQ